MEVDEATLRLEFVAGSFSLASWYFLRLSACLFCLLIGRTILMSYKHKTHTVDAEGKIISNADIDFYIDDVCVIYSITILW